MSDGMTDPLPENIRGEKVEKHVFSHDVHHEVNWGHVSLAVALIVLLWMLSRWYRDSDDTDSGDAMNGGDGLDVADVLN